MSNVLVIGAGNTGSEIARMAAAAGYEVYLKDNSQDIIQDALQSISTRLHQELAYSNINDQEREQIVCRITGLTEWPEVEFEVMIDTLAAHSDDKRKMLVKMEEHAQRKTVLAVNPAYCSLTEILPQIKYRERVIGLHFFHPVSMMKLVEIVPTHYTNRETWEIARSFVRSLDKVEMEVIDSPGLVVDRLLVPFINEAAFLVMEGTASVEDIDQAMKLGAGHPMGPLELADQLGIDVCLQTMEWLFYELGEDKFRPCPLLKRMVRAGKLGKKTGEGFYSYKEGVLT